MPLLPWTGKAKEPRMQVSTPLSCLVYQHTNTVPHFRHVVNAKEERGVVMAHCLVASAAQSKNLIVFTPSDGVEDLGRGEQWLLING